MKVALLTLEALASAEPVRRFVVAHPERIACVALSDPYRPSRGGMFGQARRLLLHSGPRLLPYLVANFSLPRIAGALPIRGRTPGKMRMRTLCARLGIPQRIVPDMNAPEFHAWLRCCGADLILTFHCDQILSQETIDCLAHGALNVHPGLLPDHRGPVPTIHALLANPPRLGTTVHRLVSRIDAGPILAQRELLLPAGTSALTAATRLHEAAVPLVVAVLDALDNGSVPERMVEPGAYCGFPTPAQLRQLARTGRRVVSWRDLVKAVQISI